MGLSLYRTFLDAGLPAPTLGLQALAGGRDSPRNGVDLIADLAITMAPVMEEHGVATAADLDQTTLHQRILDEVDANGSIVIGRYEVGAWARLARRPINCTLDG